MKKLVTILIVLTMFLTGCYPGLDWNPGVDNRAQVYYKFSDKWYYHSNSRSHIWKFSDSWYYNTTTGDSIFIFGE